MKLLMKQQIFLLKQKDKYLPVKKLNVNKTTLKVNNNDSKRKSSSTSQKMG